MCAGIVKASGIFHKNPFQHNADLEMLELASQFNAMFFNHRTDVRRPVECFGANGASDEGPIHEKVQFVWTERHLKGSIDYCMPCNSDEQWVQLFEL